MSLPHATEHTQAVMNTWRQDRPVVGLMGEFSSGKSTLLNFILGADVATTKVTATPLPPIWFTYSDAPFTLGLRDDGSLEEIDIADPDIDFRGTYLAIRRGLDSAALEGCDIIDAPGISDPQLGKNALRFLQPYFDFVFWCTSASQAWRQTERAAFDKLAKSTKENSILVVTRLDKLRSDKDRAKVMKRVDNEASALFGSMIGLQTTKATAIPLEARTDDTGSSWVATGGHGFFAAFENALSEASPKRGKTQKATASIVSSNAGEVYDAPQQDDPADILRIALKTLKTKPENSHHCRQIDHLIAAIPCDLSEQKRSRKILRACSQIDEDGLELERLISQIGSELSSFGTSDSVRLDI